MVEKSLLDIDFASLTRRTVHSVPGRLGGPGAVLPAAGPLLRRQGEGRLPGQRGPPGGRRRHAAVPARGPGRVDYDTWLGAGGGWQGGTLEGLRSKLGYLRRLGITALWVSPLFRQVAFEPSYHGYGIQNFLDVDPHFGTREEFRDFVQAAHEQGIYVILDIIAHHTGNVFTYDAGPLPDARPGLGASGTTTRAGTASPTPSRASTTATAGRRCRSTARSGPHGGGLAGRRRSGPASSSGRSCSSARGTSPTGTTTRSTSRGTCSA